ncbi:MAG: YdcF family protein [Bacteroidales bacterium]|nr:YdcF family protein [Bacteroidales bacterium]
MAEYNLPDDDLPEYNLSENDRPDYDLPDNMKQNNYPGKMSYKSRIVIILAVPVLLMAESLIVINAGKWLVRDNGEIHGDAVVILMGSIADRVLQAEYVYKQGLADRIIIVKESMGVYKALENKGVRIISSTWQVSNALTALGIPPGNIVILPGDAISTQMEAMRVRDYCLHQADIDTLLLVTSAHHTRRASMIFESAFRKKDIPVTILCSPSSFTKFDPSGWWKDKEGIQQVLLEYMKIANFLLLDKRQLK